MSQATFNVFLKFNFTPNSTKYGQFRDHDLDYTIATLVSLHSDAQTSNYLPSVKCCAVYIVLHRFVQKTLLG